MKNILFSKFIFQWNHDVKEMCQSVTRKCEKKMWCGVRDYSSFFMASLFFMGITPITFSFMSEIWLLTCPTTSSTAAWWEEMRLFNDERQYQTCCGQENHQRGFLLRASRLNNQPRIYLIVLVYKRQSEESNPCEYDEGHHIEPSRGRSNEKGLHQSEVTNQDPIYVSPHKQRMNLMVSKTLSNKKSLLSSIIEGLMTSTMKPVMSATFSGGMERSRLVTHARGSLPGSAC